MVFDPFLLLGCEELRVHIVFQVELANVYGLLRVFKREKAVVGIQASIDVEVHRCWLAPGEVGSSWRRAGNHSVRVNLTVLKAGESMHIKYRSTQVVSMGKQRFQKVCRHLRGFFARG